MTDLPESAELVLLAAMVLVIGSSLDGDLLFVAGLPLTLAAFAIACRAVWLCESQRRSRRWMASVKRSRSSVNLNVPEMAVPVSFTVPVNVVVHGRASLLRIVKVDALSLDLDDPR